MSTGSHPAAPPAPVQTERYVRESTLGRGAWGTVYRARDTVIERTVALKVISFSEDLSAAERHETAARSEREARAAGALNHPNIVTIHDAGRAPNDGSFFIVMEYVEGPTLRTRLGHGPMERAEAASIGRQLAEALGYAHGCGIVHRDVKPANILLRPDGAAKLADFGIARLESSEITRTGQSMGSPAYMSPEQALGKAAGARSDLFSLGVVLYETLTGVKPFDGETLAAICFKIVHHTPPPPSAVRPEIEPAWDALIGRLLEKDPDKRYAAAADVAADLAALERAGEGSRAVDVSAGARTLIPIAESSRSESRPAPATPEALSALTQPRARRGPDPSTIWPERALIGAGILSLCAVVAALLVPHQGVEPTAPGAEPAAVRATLRIDVIHGLRSGQVEVEMDGNTIWHQVVAGPAGGLSAARRLMGKPTGRIQGEVAIPSGDHNLTVSATGADGERWNEMTRRSFDPGEAETLSVRIRTGFSRGMELEWE